MVNYQKAFLIWRDYGQYFKHLSWLDFRDLRNDFTMEIMFKKNRKKYIEKLQAEMEKYDDKTKLEMRHLIQDIRHL